MSACPACDYFASKVNETRRLQGGWVKRHRRCLIEDCGHRWYTLEIPVSALELEDRRPDFLKQMQQGASSDD